jgi:MoCo/4Fe-4S cofactor protein with predicted Tat translocation signal
MSDEKKNGRRLDVEKMRSRLSATQGRDYWRSLGELAETEEFKRFLHDEFPALAPGWSVPKS